MRAKETRAMVDRFGRAAYTPSVDGG